MSAKTTGLNWDSPLGPLSHSLFRPVLAATILRLLFPLLLFFGTTKIGKFTPTIDVRMEKDTKDRKSEKIEDDEEVEQMNNDLGANMQNWIPEADHVENGAENDGRGENVDG